MRYRYFKGGTNGKGQKIRYCYSTKRDGAGFFSGWREVVQQNGKVRRVGNFSRSKHKKTMVKLALRRMATAQTNAEAIRLAKQFAGVD